MPRAIMVVEPEPFHVIHFSVLDKFRNGSIEQFKFMVKVQNAGVGRFLNGINIAPTHADVKE